MSRNAEMARWRRGHGPKPAPLGVLVTNEPWMVDANCAGLDADTMFPGQGENNQMNAAKRVCALCPVRAQCLEYALVHNERHGVWGGKSERERRRMRTQRRMAS